jgi:transcriptional regulator with XRE-family HTH domain
MKSLGNWIRRHKVIQVKFADQLGIGQEYLSRLIAGDRVPSIRLFKKIVKVTGIPASRLLDEIR